MKNLYNNLVRYGTIIADKNHETIEGNFIRLTAFNYHNKYYVAIKINGIVFAVAENKN